MKKSILLVTTILLFAATTPGRADEAERLKIREGMKKLAPLIGRWNVVALFHDGETVAERLGSYEISSVLEDSYLEWKVELHRKDDPKRNSQFIIFTTFDPRTNHYVQTYFYKGWALRVTESGEFDDAAREYLTTALIPLEDDVHDEIVRTITSLRDPGRIVYTHYSRYGHQKAERMDVEITMTRVR